MLLGYFTFLVYLCTPFLIHKDRNDFNCNKEESLPAREIPQINVYLNQPAELRWDPVISVFGQRLREFDVNLEKIFGYYPTKIMVFISSYIGTRLPFEYVKEMKGISKLTGIKFERVVLMNIFYEFSSLCTSIVAADVNGKMYHIRNLDFGISKAYNSTTHTYLLTHLLRTLAVKINFVRNRDVVMKAVMFAGQVGVFTGISINKFSISINQRFSPNGGFFGLLKYYFYNNHTNIDSFITRDVLLNADGYNEALTALSTSELVAPVYYILSGPKSQGAVINRERTYSKNIYQIDYHQGLWFLAQTNVDRIDPPPPIYRRLVTANKCMSRIPANKINPLSLYSVVTTEPILNELTIYTAIMIPSDMELLVFEHKSGGYAEFSFKE